MKRLAVICLLLVTVLSLSAAAKPKSEKGNRKLKEKVILVIRHAEKPEVGKDLSPKGKRRAEAYVDYFKKYQVDGEPLKLDHIYAAAESRNSDRSRLTLEPLAKSLDMVVDCRFDDDNFRKMAADIRSRPREKMVIIAWHHSNIGELIASLGADPKEVLPGGEWPDGQYSWVIELRYGEDGKLIESRRVEQNLNVEAPPSPKLKGSGWFKNR